MQQPEQQLIPVGDAATLNFNVSEIFHSIQGEGTRIGKPCVFVRLQGCTLRCVWCDTPYALDHRIQEEQLTGNKIIERIKQYPGTKFIEFTGGEPLEQFGVFPLMSALCDLGYEVAVETGGHVDLDLVDERVIRIIDVKCPDSKMSTLMRWNNLEHLRPTDEIKFVVSSKTDFDWAIEIIQQYELIAKAAAVLISTAFGKLSYRETAEWILESGLPLTFQPQLHKFIWEPDKRGV